MAALILNKSTDLPTNHGARWLHGSLRWSLSVLLGVASTSLIAAMLGIFTPWLVIPGATIVTTVVSRYLPVSCDYPITPGVLVGLLALVGTVAGLGIVSPHQHILATRDSGTYVATAAWIANTGGLEMEVGDDVIADAPVVYETVGFPSGGEETQLQPQFLHIFPSTLAFLVSVSGHLSALYWLNPLLGGLGLLTIFAFVTQVSTKPGIGLSSAFLVATTMPFLYYSRAPFSEPMAMVFVFGGLWALTEAVRNSSLRMATGAGLLLGATSMVRIDGIVVLLGLVVYRTILAYNGATSDHARKVPNASARIMDRVIAIATLTFFVSLVDMSLFSLQYLVDHGRLIGAVVAAIVVVSLIGGHPTRIRGFVIRHQTSLANGLAGLLGLWLLYAWVFRPSLESPTRPDTYDIVGLQEAAGVAVEPLRSYAELSVHWLSWYLGFPLVLVGLLGLVLMLRRLLLGHDDLAGPFVSATLILTVLYLYIPSINPDHIWAMRRFLPVVIPALVVMALLVGSRWVERSDARGTLLVSVMTIVFAFSSILTTARGGFQSEFEGAAHDLAEGCDRLGPDAVILVTGDRRDVLSDTLAPVLRGACGSTVAAESAGHPLTAAELQSIVTRVEGAGRELWVIGSDPIESSEEVVLFDTSYQFLEQTLFSAPTDWQSIDIHITAWSPS